MLKILKKERLAENISKIIVDAPHIANAAKPGQFVVIVPSKEAERIPLTIADFDKEKGTITIIFQVMGATTKVLDLLKEGDGIPHVLGPLGVPSEIERFGKVVVIAGGVGIAEIYPLVKALKEIGNEVVTIIGARCKDLLIYEEELRARNTELRIRTDDGSLGNKGFVSEELIDLINSGIKIDRVIAVGPVLMMKAICDITKSHYIKTIVSLNPLMLDATGMCGICRVTVNNESKLTCVDGPEFDGHLVDFEELIARLKTYKTQEKEAMDHVCRLMNVSSTKPAI